MTQTLLDLIGNTPLVKVTRLDTGPCELFLKLESQNPGGSIKDRIGRSMIQAAEDAGQVGPHQKKLVEATAGNTGLGLALVASLKGYGLTLVIPDKMSQEKVTHLRALGAKVDVKTDPRALLPLFDRGLVPLVVEGATFIGLITRMDLLTHLRRQLH